MNLIVSTRIDALHVRLDVAGKWRYGDALGLAYLVKAGALKAGRAHVLVDLRRLVTPPGVYGKFLLCDRLLRALTGAVSIALISIPDLLDVENAKDAEGGARMACFESENDALRWLHRKNPSDLRAEG